MTTKRTSRFSRSPYWVLSMVLHVVLLGWLIWYGPVRDIILERGKPKREALIRGKELEKVVEQMQLSVAEELEDRVALLKAGQDRMATNFDTLNAHFQPYEANQKATAQLRFEKYASTLQTDQQALFKLLNDVLVSKNYDAAAQAGQEKLPVMISALDEVRRGVLLLSADQAIADLHTQAETALFEVEKPLRDIGNLLGRYRRLESEIKQARAELASLTPAADEAQRQLKEQQDIFEKLDRDRKQAQDKFNELRKGKDREAIKQASETSKQANDLWNKQRSEMGRFTRADKDAQNKLSRAKQQLGQKEEAFNGIKLDVDLTRMLEMAISRLNDAMTLEKQVILQVRDAKVESDKAAS